MGATAILIGVGGSATNDLGLGALGALGLEFLTAEGRSVRTPVPARWPEIARLGEEVFRSIPPIRIACDVANPLLGPKGAAAVFAPQKGLQPGQGGRLDSESARMAAMLCEHCGKPPSLADAPGAGAAGGFAFGFLAAARARLLPGYALVAAWLDLESRLAAADLVLTGEGRFDGSSLGGKGPGALAARALELGKPTHVFAGQVALPKERAGVLALHAISPPGEPLEEAKRNAAAHLTAAVQEVF
jgi:glycerate kinase